MTDFRLFETMRVCDRKVVLLERHLERLGNSAEHFAFKYDPGALRAEIVNAVSNHPSPAYLRATLWPEGARDLAFGALPSDNPRWLRLSRLRVDSANPFLYHKTSQRGIYDEARRGCDADTDVLLINERGEITETTIANVAVLRGGLWITPHLFCGLLPGVRRAELWANGDISEGIIRADELSDGELIRCFNALRGVFEASFVRDNPAADHADPAN